MATNPTPISTTVVNQAPDTSSARLASNVRVSPAPAGRIPTSPTPITPVRRK